MLAELGVDPAQVRQVLVGEVVPGLPGRAIRLVRVQDRGGPVRGDDLGDAAGGELAQHGVQPAGGLGAQRGQLAVPAGPDPQHGRVVIGADLVADGRAQRGNRDRAGVIRVVLVRCPGDSSRTRAPSLGWTSTTCSPAATQLLGQQVAQAAGALDGPGPLRPARRPLEQPAGLAPR